MTKELEERIERKKRQIADLLKIAKKVGLSSQDLEIRIDSLLEDLQKLKKQR